MVSGSHWLWGLEREALRRDSLSPSESCWFSDGRYFIDLRFSLGLLLGLLAFRVLHGLGLGGD